jgi:hypothetical protein
MKNKILIITILAMAIIFTNNIYASAQGNNTKTIENDNQNQQQTQNSEQNQNETIDYIEKIEVEIKPQTAPNLQNETRTIDQIRKQNQIEDQNEIQNQIQTREQNQNEIGNQIETDEEKSQNKNRDVIATEQRRSEVANTVQELLQIADRNGGIGQQVRIIAQNQVQNQEELEKSLQQIQNRSKFVKFFVGPNYNEINKAKKILEQNREQINQLNQIKNQINDQNDIQNLNQQIQVLEQINLEIENFLETSQKGFSLFGWLSKILSK